MTPQAQARALMPLPEHLPGKAQRLRHRAKAATYTQQLTPCEPLGEDFFYGWLFSVKKGKPGRQTTTCIFKN